MTFTLDQFKGVFERVIYGLVLAVCLKLVQKGYMDPEMAPYTAGGAVALSGGVVAWVRNRPANLLDRAGDSISKNNVLVITPSAAATHEDRKEARELAATTGDKVTAKT